MSPRRQARLSLVAALALAFACTRDPAPEPTGVLAEESRVAPIASPPVLVPPPVIAPPTPPSVPACPRARAFAAAACEHLRPVLCAKREPCTPECELLPRTAEIEIDDCDPADFVALRSRLRETPSIRDDRHWIGYLGDGESWLLDQPIVSQTDLEVGHRVTSAYRELPGPGAGPRGAVFGVEGLFTMEGGSSYSEELEFSAEVTCRVRKVPTCTAPIVLDYAWSQLLASRFPRESEYAAAHSEDDASQHLRVKVEKRSRARGDPAESLGLVMLRTGDHAYNRLLTRKLVMLAPARAAVRGP